MGDINLQEIFDTKCIKYSVDSSSERFTLAFFYALKRLVYDLNSPKVGLSISSVPDSLEEDMDLDEKYCGVVYDGLDFYLQDSGEWGSQDERISRADYMQSLSKAHTQNLTDSTVYTRLGEIDTDEDED